MIATALAFLKGVPRPVYYGIAAAVAIFAVVLFVVRWSENNQQIGRTIEREENTRAILERTEQGNEARETIERESRIGTGDNLYRQCLRTARTPANCERFLPQ